MFRRSRWSRTVAAVFAPWFAVVMAEPAALHTCAMHSGHVMPAGSAMAGMMVNTPAASQGADMDMGAAPTEPAPSHQKTEKDCTCLGGCCAVAPVAAPVSNELSWVPEAIRRPVPIASSCGVRATATDHVLPFANGPPSLV